MFFRKTDNKALSPAKLSWQKFKSDRIAIIAISWIAINVLLAILGYFITPDSSPYANHQQLELRVKEPGFKVKTLWVMKNQPRQTQNIFYTMLFGRSMSKTAHTMHSWEICNAELTMKSFTGDADIPGQEKTFCIADILFSINVNAPKHIDNDSIYFFLYDGDEMVKSINDLQKQVVSQNINYQYFLLGTDQFGRDMLSQIIIGTRVSLSVGFIAVLISLLIGVALGSIAGFFRGKTDDFIVWLINIVWSLPTLIMVIAITFAIGKGYWQVFIAVGLTMWVDVARVTRGQIISIREKDFVESARALGINTYRIIKKHILPNMYGPLIVISAANFASAILIEAGLSFLGMGVQPPTPSWGSMIKENYGYIVLDKAFLAILPGIFIMLIVLSFLLVGNSLRDALDKTQKN